MSCIYLNRISMKIVVCPTWEEECEANEAVMAFGTVSDT